MSTRHIRLCEPNSKLSARCVLLDDAAPQSAAFLWALAGTQDAYDAIHAMWTGPEISCPLPGGRLPEDLAAGELPQENATSFPDAGDIVVAFAQAGSLKGLPPGNFFDVGIFYGAGGRLFMPFGWLMGNVAAQILPEDLNEAQAACKAIRESGACQLRFERA